jgi:hypothetical protein
MYAIVLDTETTNSIDDPICYDIGWAVINLDTEEVIKTESYTVFEIFLDKELMQSAFYAEKIPSYWEEITKGERKLARLNTIRKTLRADCESYNVKEIYAHNARFDYRSCNLTQRFLTSSKYRYFFPFGITICDTLKMARNLYKNDPKYAAFCEENGYKTQNGANRLTAEIIYRYLSGEKNFTEEHKGLDDVMIEKEILFECRRKGVKNGALWD